jgi:hypothetical protein
VEVAGAVPGVVGVHAGDGIGPAGHLPQGVVFVQDGAVVCTIAGEGLRQAVAVDVVGMA